MKHPIFFLLLTMVMSMRTTRAHAYDAEIDGIYYNFNGDEAEVTKKDTYGLGSSSYYGDVVIPATVTYSGKTYKVTTIGDGTFSQAKVNVILPEGVRTIGAGAFQGAQIVSMSIPSSVTRIKKNAFHFWNPKIDENGNVLNKIPKIIVKDISAWMKIEHESELFSVEIDKTGSNSSGGMGSGWVLYTADGSELTELVVPEDIDSIRAYAFAGCRSITSVTMPDCVKSIGKHAFYRCLLLNTVKVGDGVTTIGDYAFSISDSENCRGYDGYDEYYKKKYEGIPRYGLKSLSLGKSIRNIDANAFEFNNLSKLTLPEALETIGKSAFYSCGKLLSLVVPNKVTDIGEYAFYGGAYAKTYRDEFQSVVIGSGVVSIGHMAFGCPVKTIWLTNTPPKNYKIATGNINYVANDQYKFDATSVDVRIYPLLSSIFSVDGIKYVPVSMSERTCDAIDAVYDESAELTKIGTEVTYRGVKMNVGKVLPWTCCGNTYIKNVTLSGLTCIDNNVFDGCSNLGKIVLPETVTFLGESSFRGCSSLKEITIPAATTNVKSNAFDDCSALKDIIMADGFSALTLSFNAEVEERGGGQFRLVPTKGTPLFEDCPLDSVYIGRNLQYGVNEKQGFSPFYRNTSLRSVRITDAETVISVNEFYGCSGMKNVWIGNGVTAIEEWAFSGCSSLDYFEYGSNMNYIGQEAFSDCANVTKIISHAAMPPTCGPQALDDINKWNCTLYVPDASLGAYQQADQWKEFLFTQKYSEFTEGIGSIVIDGAAVNVIYSISGQRLNVLKKGINIVDGKKLIVR